MSQAAIRRALLDGKKFTAMTASRAPYHCWRLAAVIHRLRKGTSKLPALRIITEERTQGGKTFAVYKLLQCPECGGNHTASECDNGG